MQEGDEITREYNQMRQILAELIEKTRSFTFDLSNPVLYELGLETALEEWLSGEIEAKLLSGINAFRNFRNRAPYRD